jgi:hypothetical protein
MPHSEHFSSFRVSLFSVNPLHGHCRFLAESSWVHQSVTTEILNNGSQSVAIHWLPNCTDMPGKEASSTGTEGACTAWAFEI